MLNCCGAPADWAGDAQIHSATIEKIKCQWISLGKPTAIFACSMCRQMFQRYLPEINSVFIYNLIEEKGIIPSAGFNKTVSVFDPCASRHEPDLQSAVRTIASKAGFNLEPLPMEGKMAECCSYGGQVSVAHPPYASHMVQKRISQNSNPYITYCSNCRDVFAKAGKETMHILDVVFGIDDHTQPTVTERRENRLKLKLQVIKQFWNEDMAMENKRPTLSVPPGLKAKLDKSLILESDLITVIESCEQSGNKLFNPERKTFTGHLQVGNTTFWVEYRVVRDSEYELVNSYSHRMKIEE